MEPRNSDINGRRTILYDLDGTLIDHFRTIHRGYCHVMQELGLEPVSYESLRAAVGGSIVVTFGKLVPKEYVDEAVVRFREYFPSICHEGITVLPGAEWLLANLKARGFKQAIFTNKEGATSRTIADHTGLSQHLDAVFGTLDTPYRKPEPEFTDHALAALGSTAKEAFIIGDSPYDIAAARGRGLPCYTVATGSHSLEQLRAEEAVTGVFPDLVALGQELFGLRPQAT